MRRRRVLEVEMNSAVDCLVRGPGAGEILLSITGRRQVYSALRRGYSVQEKTARDAVAIAERLSYDVTISGPRSAPVRDHHQAADHHDDVDLGAEELVDLGVDEVLW